jgi:aldehyde:ferredoxin oxidoreductase
MTDIDSSKYLPEYIGGVGLGWRILWEETNANTTEWSPENTLIFASGPANASSVPTAGRQEVIGIAPYGFPIPWAAQSGSGGDWSSKLKWTGYDAVVITGKSATPKYVYIDDAGAKLLDASYLWGTGTFATQQSLESQYGKDIAALCIGQAGENKLRIATIEQNGEGSMGQGGFGAVMGDKKLKCICVKPGNHKVTWANPTAMIEVTKKLSYELGPITPNNPISTNNTAVKQYFGSTTSGTGYVGRRLACPYSNCQANDHDDLYWSYNRVPSLRGYGEFTSTCGCSGGNGISGGVLASGNSARNVTMELHNLMCNWGINAWGSTFGSMITDAWKANLIRSVDGMPLDSSGKLSLDNMIQFFRDIVNRTGPEGNIWAEGGARAAKILGWGDASSPDPAQQGIAWRYWKHGYGTHWDGRTQGSRFPMWIGSALNWAVWGRDPFNDSHGWPERVPWYVLEWGGKGGALANKDMTGRDAIPYADLCKAAAKLYGTTGVYQGNACPDALAGYPGLPDDSLGYKDMEYAMYWHNHQEWFKNSMVMCDCVLPLLYSSQSSDLLGYYSAEEDAFNAATGAGWSFAKCHQQAEKIFNLMRAFHVRQGRTRAHDESIIRYFTDIPSGSSLSGHEEEHYLKKDKFIALLERYYTLRGWDKTTGWPTRAKLESLGLKDVADQLATLKKLPA